MYESQDFQKAIVLAASGQVPLEKLITHTYPLERLEEGFKQMEDGGNAMKILLSCS